MASGMFLLGLFQISRCEVSTSSIDLLLHFLRQMAGDIWNTDGKSTV